MRVVGRERCGGGIIGGGCARVKEMEKLDKMEEEEKKLKRRRRRKRRG